MNRPWRGSLCSLVLEVAMASPFIHQTNGSPRFSPQFQAWLHACSLSLTDMPLPRTMSLITLH